MHEHAIKIPTSKIYEILEKSECIKEIINTGITNATVFGTAHELFLQLNKIADTLSSKSINISNDSFIFKRISISPTGQYQAWLIMDKIIIVSENAAWLVLHDSLFCDGELMIRNPTWDEKECILTFILFYPVYDEYKLCKTCFSDEKKTPIKWMKYSRIYVKKYIQRMIEHIPYLTCEWCILKYALY